MAEDGRRRTGAFAVPTRGRTTHNEISLASVDEALYSLERRVKVLEETAAPTASAAKTDIAVLKEKVESLTASRNWWRSAVPVSIAVGLFSVAMQLKNCT